MSSIKLKHKCLKEISISPSQIIIVMVANSIVQSSTRTFLHNYGFVHKNLQQYITQKPPYSIIWASYLEIIASTEDFPKLPTIQEWQYCQLRFSCAIRNELNWLIKSSKYVPFSPLITNFTFTIIIFVSRNWER